MKVQLLGQTITVLTPLVVPLLVVIVKKLQAFLPGWLLPIVATVIGIGLDALNGLVTGQSLGPVWGGALGAAGVAVREVVDQLKRS